MATSAGIVLAGGLSSRMGSPKANLAWHGSTLLCRVAGIVARSVDGPVVVVGAPGQALPELPGEVQVARDAVSGEGPLRGLACGLARVGGGCEVTLVMAGDAPFLNPAFVARVLAGCSDGFDICVPVVRGFAQPLAGAYRPSVLGEVEAILASGGRRLGLVADRCQTRWVDEAWLLDDPAVALWDPLLESVRNLNSPAEYAAALACPEPQVSVDLAHGSVSVRTSTLGAAAAAVGAALPDWVSLNGEWVRADPGLPLVAGDTLGLC